MAKLVSYNFDDTHWADIVTAICTRRGYQDTIPDPADPTNTIPNPQSREDFTMQSALLYWESEFTAWYINMTTLSKDLSAQQEAQQAVDAMNANTEKTVTTHAQGGGIFR